MTVVKFTIGNAFPASDPVARFITGLSMISNDWLRSMKDLLGLTDEGAEEMGLRVSLFRRQAALVHEAATFIADAQRLFPEIAAFVAGLEKPALENCGRVLHAVDRASTHYLGDWLRPTGTSLTTTRSCTRKPTTRR